MKTQYQEAKKNLKESFEKAKVFSNDYFTIHLYLCISIRGISQKYHLTQYTEYLLSNYFSKLLKTIER